MAAPPCIAPGRAGVGERREPAELRAVLERLVASRVGVSGVRQTAKRPRDPR